MEEGPVTFDRVYPNKKRYLIGLRSMAWDGVQHMTSQNLSGVLNFVAEKSIKIPDTRSCSTLLRLLLTGR